MADVLFGGIGGGSLVVGAGPDSLFGASGDDVFYVANQTDFLAGYLYDGGDGDETLLLGAGAPSWVAVPDPPRLR